MDCCGSDVVPGEVTASVKPRREPCIPESVWADDCCFETCCCFLHTDRMMILLKFGGVYFGNQLLFALDFSSPPPN